MTFEAALELADITDRFVASIQSHTVQSSPTSK